MIVMKFGGTSVESSTAIDRVAKIVCGRLDEKPAVVVSAMSKFTDQLVAMSKAAGAGDKDTALQLSLAARERHFQAASELLSTGVFTDLHSELERDFNGLDDLLRGISAVGELTPRTTDNVLSFGERVNAKIVAAGFEARGIKSQMLDSRQVIVTDHQHTKAVPQFDEIDFRLKEFVKPALDQDFVP